MGIKEELAHARPNATKVIVLLSDGVPNRYCNVSPSSYTASCPSMKTDTSGAKQAARDMADYAMANKIKVFTISYGNEADPELMAEIASRTGGTAYVAPDDAALQAAFIAIGKSTNIKLSQ
jgi:Mg-chelatase subunit ChlD